MKTLTKILAAGIILAGLSGCTDREYFFQKYVSERKYSNCVLITNSAIKAEDTERNTIIYNILLDHKDGTYHLTISADGFGENFSKIATNIGQVLNEMPKRDPNFGYRPVKYKKVEGLHKIRL